MIKPKPLGVNAFPFLFLSLKICLFSNYLSLRWFPWHNGFKIVSLLRISPILGLLCLPQPLPDIYFIDIYGATTMIITTKRLKVYGFASGREDIKVILLRTLL